ncbi:MAG: thiamine-phosphate synthase family protein [Fervidicoccaceae archaeon]|nr:MAG: hypothetical protein C0177_01790 [Fervidicoccus fontis]
MFPHELISKHIAPDVRGLIAHFLSERGLGQFKVAKIMGISQPMVNKLLSKPKSFYLKELEKAGINREEIERIVELSGELLYEGKKLNYLNVISSYFNYLLKSGRLCPFHRELFPEIPRECDICMKIFQVYSEPLSEEVKAAIELLQRNPLSYKLIPEVGSNIVVADYSSMNPEEFVGISGKIVAVENRIVPLGEPIIGGSKHTSRVLHTVKKKFPSIAAAFIVKYHEACIEIMRKKRYTVISVGPHKSLEELYSDFEIALSNLSSPPDAIADRGGSGIEPVIYIFANNAREAVKKAFICFEESKI